MSSKSSSPDHWMHEDLEQATRTIGILATMFLGLSLFPVTRGNFINRYCLGLSFEGAVKYHRLLGSLMGICGILHAIGWFINFDKAVTLHTTFVFFCVCVSFVKVCFLS